MNLKGLWLDWSAKSNESSGNIRGADLLQLNDCLIFNIFWYLYGQNGRNTLILPILKEVSYMLFVSYLLFFVVVVVGGRWSPCGSPRGTAASYWPIVPVPGDCEDGEVGGMKCGWQGKPKYSEKTCPSAILSTTNSTCQTRARTWAAAVGSQRLTAWAMARTLILIWSKYSPQHPVLKHPQSMFLPYCQRPNFTPIHNHRYLLNP
jgi:hypothetical protein